MGLLSGLLKAGIANKVIAEARKPHNQQKAKELFQQVRGKSGKGGSTGGSTGGTSRRP